MATAVTLAITGLLQTKHNKSSVVKEIYCGVMDAQQPSLVSHALLFLLASSRLSPLSLRNAPYTLDIQIDGARRGTCYRCR